MAKPEKVNPAKEAEVKSKKVAAEVAEDENVEEAVELSPRELADEADAAFVDGKKWKALSILIEAKTGYKMSQADARAVLDAVSAFVIMSNFNGNAAKLPNLGSLYFVDVAEKKGVAKFQGTEKPWVSPAHTTVKFIASDIAKELASTDGDNYAEVLDALFNEAEAEE